MHEHATWFGRAQHLFGIVGHPSSQARTTGVIVLNAGLVHHVGPFRLHVQMTRQLNACGFPTLRFDLSTVGDSGASHELQSREQQVQSDVASAMALLREQSGCSRFVLIGLCSGAQNAHLVAQHNDAVAGAVFLDGYGYRTRGYKARHYLPRLLNPARVLRFITRRLRPVTATTGSQFQVEFPPQARVREELAGMVQRGLKLCFIYSGGASWYFNHQRQFGECYGATLASHPGISVSFLKEVDHTYVLADDRKRLVDTIEQWLRMQFPQLAQVEAQEPAAARVPLQVAAR
ncbi:Serine aminopeptidase, S33 [Pseudoxanthomonas sp. GM95]|uniref:dienelactone hydrolase family protein n=1 Tax=Pseudoxanthomonas sp. GM95 TaxID=1881043 RepID=UPI0008CAC767|nr:dienelactone hydrolase family protein [Pseudoxanthomonas sp. GM95]SEL09658.1 Serine aminopeptidase, S33 [Pseudoxanthomonas sp. GM95]